jgi:hypothetical protein
LRSSHLLPGTGAKMSEDKMWHSLLPTRRSLFLLLAVLALPGHALGEETARHVSGPFTHENLLIYLIHGQSAEGTAPLTLEEAMQGESVRVHETGEVSQLLVENLSDHVFIQSGDIVKGGKQDRVLTVSMMLRPRSGLVPIGSYCVEAGRWAARGSENVGLFASSTRSAPSRDLKLALKATLLPEQNCGRGSAISSQGEVWRIVARTQDELSKNVGSQVAATASSSSLQLALENARLKEAEEKYLNTLLSKGETKDDVIGYAFAVNGKLSSADLYPSNALFRKMWPKLLRTSATEAIAEPNEGPATTAPSREAVLAFLEEAESGKTSSRALSGPDRLEIRDGAEALLFETSLAVGGWLHRSYVAK